MCRNLGQPAFDVPPSRSARFICTSFRGSCWPQPVDFGEADSRVDLCILWILVRSDLPFGTRVKSAGLGGVGHHPEVSFSCQLREVTASATLTSDGGCLSFGVVLQQMARNAWVKGLTPSGAMLCAKAFTCLNPASFTEFCTDDICMCNGNHHALIRHPA